MDLKTSMLMNLVLILIAFGSFQAFFISIALFINKNRNIRNILFAIILFTEGLSLFERLLIETNLLISIPHFYGASYPWGFIRGPLLFLFAISVINPQFKFKLIHILHFLPLFTVLIVFAPFYLQNAESKISMIQSMKNYSVTYLSSSFFISLFLFLQLGIYIYIAIKKIKEAPIESRNNRICRWYLNVIRAFGFFLLLGFIYLVQIPAGLIQIKDFGLINMLIMTLLIQSLAYSLFNNFNFFNISKKQISYSVEENTTHENLIINLLEKEKIYLNDRLNIDEMAKSLNLSKQRVSDIINQRFGRNFKNLINHYRVMEAQSIMMQEKDNVMQLIDIGLDSGFNNKVSFYRVFKQFTGQSPSAYLEEIRSHTEST